MLKTFLILNVLVFALTSHGQTPYWQQEVSHRIDVTLHAGDRTLDGFERIIYTNNAPDTLTYIWFHLAPNAYKNDKTAFSNQMLLHGDTRFYFSPRNDRGYINRLDFKVNDTAARWEDHPEHIDVIKLLLPRPLPPRHQVVITTPFHVKLPAVFSTGGFQNGAWQVTQWYPKPAVYDRTGWHPMPTVQQGGSYSEFGNYDVSITVPQDYVVAATGVLQGTEEGEWLRNRPLPGLQTRNEGYKTRKTSIGYKPGKNNRSTGKAPSLSVETKTLRFLATSISDFVFFANPEYLAVSDTCLLGSGNIIEVSAYYTDPQNSGLKNSLPLLKEAVRYYSISVGEYPHATLTAVQGVQNTHDGISFPTISLLAPARSERELHIQLIRQVGQQWFPGMLGSNSREHPWMSLGLNHFYAAQFVSKKFSDQNNLDKINFLSKAALQKDQPIATHAEELSNTNYPLISGYKTAEWLRGIQEKLDEGKMNEVLQQYYNTWKGKHPSPADLQSAFTEVSGTGMEASFDLLHQRGTLPNQELQGFSILTPLQPKTFHHYFLQPTRRAVVISPAVGYNSYDKVLLGAVVSNYVLPPSPFRFLVLPFYATGSRSISGAAHLQYSLPTNGVFEKIDLSLSGLSFSKNRNRDSNDNKLFERFAKITPAIRATWREAPTSSRKSWLEARSYLIRDKEFSSFVTKSANNLNYVDSMDTFQSNLVQLTYFSSDERALYPYHYSLQLQAGPGFYRANVTGNYFFNYASGGGASVRAFAAKFGYTSSKSSRSFSTIIYQPKLLGVTGEEDYTYSSYFLGRTASYANDDAVDRNSGLAAQQISIRDGGLKLRIDQYEFLQGRSENWVASINLATTIPKALLPIPVPLKLFADIGSYAEAWKEAPETGKFLYVAGLELTLIKDIIHIYLPVFYSNEFRTYLKTLPGQNAPGRRLTFSIDIKQLTGRKIFGPTYPL
ncbi:MAG: M1 family metallopeptidase [Chitinophagaceae bacterium]